MRPIEPLLLDDGISEIMGNPDASWWYERDGILRRDASVYFDAGKLRTGLEVIANPLCANISETSSPSTITVGRGKKSHFDEHKQDKYFFRCVGSFGA